jgi:TetR/AcrR family transcriptional repressor of nem operon
MWIDMSIVEPGKNGVLNKMSRLKKINPEEAVQAAMGLFWKHGYNNLGTRQLEEETGITRFSLQTSYGGKWSLFLSALDSYLDIFEMHGRPEMSDGSLDTIAEWFEARAQPVMMAEASCYGCFLLNSTVEFGSVDEEVNLRKERFFTMVREGFRKALNAVKQNGNVAADFDENAMAEILLSVAIGLNIVIRSAADNAAGGYMARSIAQMIRGWGNR